MWFIQRCLLGLIAICLLQNDVPDQMLGGVLRRYVPAIVSYFHKQINEFIHLVLLLISRNEPRKQFS